MPGTTSPLLCPDCKTPLRQDNSKFNIVVDLCPHDHGVFFDEGDLNALVGDASTKRIRAMVKSATKTRGECANCHGPLRDFVLNEIPARGCTACGSLWFDNEILKKHVHEIRRRAYGERSMAARIEVMRDATTFYPVEVVAGILTEFQLEQEP